MKVRKILKAKKISEAQAARDARGSLIVLKFGELWLKGGNRNGYIRLLEQNIKAQLAGESFSLSRDFDRLQLRCGADSGAIIAKLQKVFGLSSIEPAREARPTLDSIAEAASGLLNSALKPGSVLISSHRAYKQLPFDSRDVVARLQEVARSSGIETTTKGYEKELRVSVKADAAFVSLDRFKGAGGLPVGSSGKCIVLISGGIDSPVAAWYAMKRGAEPVYVHVHAFATNGNAEHGKVAELIGLLSGYCPKQKAYFVPSHVFQAKAARFGGYEPVLFKAFLLKLAEKVAEKEGASSVYTGDSLGQVASQTAVNLVAEQRGIELPIMRPLIGFDKEEIVAVARRIGTYEESIKQYPDVCSINARHPKTAAKREVLGQMMKRMGMASVVTRSLRSASVAAADAKQALNI